MNINDPSKKFFQDEPKLPDMYVLWLELAQVAHKLEPFAKGDRSPAAINTAREAQVHLKTARQELIEAELFISAQVRTADQQHEQSLEVWAAEVDRPDLQVPEIGFDTTGDPRGADRMEPITLNRTGAEALVGHARAVFNSPNCYNCGHPKNAHGGGQDPDVGPGCAVIVEHGYPCDCPKFATGTARPVAEINGRPAGYNEFSDVLDEMDQAQTESVNRQFTEDLGRHFGNEDPR